MAMSLLSGANMIPSRSNRVKSRVRASAVVTPRGEIAL
jgi:hypothetical protein